MIEYSHQNFGGYIMIIAPRCTRGFVVEYGQGDYLSEDCKWQRLHYSKFAFIHSPESVELLAKTDEIDGRSSRQVRVRQAFFNGLYTVVTQPAENLIQTLDDEMAATS